MIDATFINLSTLATTFYFANAMLYETTKLNLPLNQRNILIFKYHLTETSCSHYDAFSFVRSTLYKVMLPIRLGTLSLLLPELKTTSTECHYYKNFFHIKYVMALCTRFDVALRVFSLYNKTKAWYAWFCI